MASCGTKSVGKRSKVESVLLASFVMKNQSFNQIECFEFIQIMRTSAPSLLSAECVEVFGAKWSSLPLC